MSVATPKDMSASMPNRLRLGVNIDHVATLRNARGGAHPDLQRAAAMAMAAGADSLTAHLREDRRHIRDEDIAMLARSGHKLNLEMAATEEMLEIALRTRPHACCIVPEKREELTTEGGLDVAGANKFLSECVAQLTSANIPTFLFIEPDPAQIEASARVSASGVELHVGAYCLDRDPALYARVADAARTSAKLGLEVHAGHGIDYASVQKLAALPELTELNIGHFLVGEAVFTGFATSIVKMRTLMDEARAPRHAPHNKKASA